MERQTPTTQVKYNDAFSKALIESTVRYLGEETIPSLEKKNQLDDFSKKDPKEKASPADPAIVLSTGSGPKQSHGAEIKYTNVVRKEEAELVGTTYEIVMEDGETIIIEKTKMDGVDDNGSKTCWKGYKKEGTKSKGGKEVNDCVKAGYEPEGDVIQEKNGLYANIHAKKKRGESPAKSGSEDYPEKDAFKKSAMTAKKEGVERVNLQDIVEKAVGKSQEKFLAMIQSKKKGEPKDSSEKDADDSSSEKKKEVKEGDCGSEKKKPVKEGMDPVGKEDSDVDNNGKVDKSDKFLKNRRSKVSKIINAKKKVDEIFSLHQEIINEKKH